jgi:glycosyltransferase involved in cell wall biosynthesis
VLEAFEKFGNYKLVLISNWDVSAYSRNLYQKYKDYPNIILQSAVYDIAELNAIRGSAFCYIHSHSRCGSSPSLIEAMNIGQAIISYDVPTNRETTHNKAFYFKNAEDLFDILSVLSLSEIERNKIIMKDIAVKEYSWKIVSNQYRQIIDGVL